MYIVNTSVRTLGFLDGLRHAAVIFGQTLLGHHAIDFLLFSFRVEVYLEHSKSSRYHSVLDVFAIVILCGWSRAAVYASTGGNRTGGQAVTGGRVRAPIREGGVPVWSCCPGETRPRTRWPDRKTSLSDNVFSKPTPTAFALRVETDRRRSSLKNASLYIV